MAPDYTPADQLGHDVVEVEVRGRKYKIGALEWGDLVAFEARLRERWRAELKELLPSMPQLDAQQAAQMLSSLLAHPFAQEDVRRNMETPAGSAWMVERIVRRHQPDFRLDGLSPVEVIELSDAIAARSALARSEGGGENPSAASSGGAR